MRDSQESSENYLEAILILGMRRPVVRSVDVANFLGYKKPSVSVAVKKLRESGDLEVSPEGYLNLTKSGRRTARMIYERHVMLSDWLEYLGVDPEIAIRDACRMEHVISKESFKAMKKHFRDEHPDVFKASKEELAKA